MGMTWARTGWRVEARPRAIIFHSRKRRCVPFKVRRKRSDNVGILLAAIKPVIRKPRNQKDLFGQKGGLNGGCGGPKRTRRVQLSQPAARDKSRRPHCGAGLLNPMPGKLLTGV